MILDHGARFGMFGSYLWCLVDSWMVMVDPCGHLDLWPTPQRGRLGWFGSTRASRDLVVSGVTRAIILCGVLTRVDLVNQPISGYVFGWHLYLSDYFYCRGCYYLIMVIYLSLKWYVWTCDLNYGDVLTKRVFGDRLWDGQLDDGDRLVGCRSRTLML
jgi:hypothetical protein